MIQSLIQLFVNILKLRYKKTLSNALARVQKYRFSIAKILFFKPNETLLMFASPNSICMPHSTLIERITATPYRDLDSNCRRKKTPITEQANSIILQHPRSIFHVSARSPFSFARCAFTYTHTQFQPGTKLANSSHSHHQIMTPHKLKINNDAQRPTLSAREINTSRAKKKRKNVKVRSACLHAQLRAAQIFIIW
jgi:hypothetical protein